jgi:20S proteasome subunit beta 6|eukprot:TRINITY_DN202_c0_g3_i3.p1 TRINITY_DN202_c0_g3~~TRINITY_DN202_c0_g3_i3.p1  ORF type:complete len:259 (-),score=117.10 TRINITY_DN202_c0_g3_i3:180-956(-)
MFVPGHQEMYDQHRYQRPVSLNPMDIGQQQPSGARERRGGRFSPYVNNGGTCMGLAGTGPDGSHYAILAADTRLSDGYNIRSRTVSKLFKLTDRCVLSTSGMQADIATLVKTLEARLVMFKHQHGYDMPTVSVAQMLSNILYSRRFFPFYTFNVLGGLDADGVGCVFAYDAIGSFERGQCSVSGTGKSLIQPVLDNQISENNQLVRRAAPLDCAGAFDLLKDAFASAGERDIYTGDTVEAYVLTAEGIRLETFELKKD